MARRIGRLLWRSTIQMLAIVGAVVCARYIVDKALAKENGEESDVDYVDDDWDANLDPGLNDEF